MICTSDLLPRRLRPFLDLFDASVSVEEVKVYKVNPRVYNHGADRLNLTNAGLGHEEHGDADKKGQRNHADLVLKKPVGMARQL
jgi:hypothetical protein